MPTLPRPGDLLADKYRLEAELGRGAMGAVFRARHLVTGKQVAIKCQLPSEQRDPDDMARFLAEARAAAAVTHPNIVDVYDVGEADGALYLVMEHLDGVPLRALLGRGPLPIGPALRTMVDVMRGIAAAHRSGVVHRDLKPDNILLQRHVDGSAQGPKVLDFGIAKLRAGSGGSGAAGVSVSVPSLTATGAVLGTPHYMSPEQAEASRQIDARADIYALGVMLYELLAGARPYEGGSVTAVLLRAARGEHVPLRSLRPEVPPALAQAITTAMSPRAEDRFARIGAFIDAVQPFAAAEGLELSDAAPDIALDPTAAATPLAVESRRPARRLQLFGVPVLWLLLTVAAISFGLVGLRVLRTPEAPAVSAPAATPTLVGAPPPAVQPGPSPAPPPAVEAAPPPAPSAATHVGGSPAPRPQRKPRHTTSAVPTPPATEEKPAPPPPRGRLGVGFGKDDF